MEGRGLRLSLVSGGNITPGSIGVFTTTHRQVVAGGAANAAKIAGVILDAFNKSSIVAGDTVAVVASGETVDVRKVTGVSTAIAAGEYVMIGDATGAAAKATAAAGANVNVVGQAVEASGDDDVIVTIRVCPFIYTA